MSYCLCVCVCVFPCVCAPACVFVCVCVCAMFLKTPATQIKKKIFFFLLQESEKWSPLIFFLNLSNYHDFQPNLATPPVSLHLLSLSLSVFISFSFFFFGRVDK